MQRMSGLDAGFLYFESSHHLMHIGLVAFVRPDGDYSFARMRAALAARVEEIPALRSKVHHVPLGLAHPVWVSDRSFDLDRHVHRVGVPAPGGPSEVDTLIGHLFSLPLDRSRPLWEMWFVEGLADGRVAVLMKVHHALVDGVAGASLVAQLCGLEPSAPTPVGREAGRDATDLELFGRGLVTLAAKPIGLARIVPNTILGLHRTARRVRAGTTMAAPFRAPRTVFNAAVSPHRTVAFADLDLGAMKEVRAATGATVNDVLLAVCGGALRSYLASRGELPTATLVANVPVSVRSSSARDLGSNKVMTLFTTLGTDQDGPLERLAAVSRSSRSAKEHVDALGADVLHDWAEIGAGRLVAAALQTYSSLRLADRHPVIHNLVVSNIPGPREPLHFLGEPVEGIHPLGPVLDGAGLNVTVLSTLADDGRSTLHVGLNACRELVPDLGDLADLFAPALDELVQAVRATAGRAVPLLT